MSDRARTISLWDPAIVRQASLDAVKKLDPRVQIKNPVMFIVEVGSLLTTVVFLQELLSGTGQPLFTGQVAFWLWFTVLFANFAEAMAEGRGKAQADTLRKTRTETVAHRVLGDGRTEIGAGRDACARTTSCAWSPASSSPPTARSSKASPRWTNRRSPANPRPSSASPAATGRRSPAARA